MLAAVFKRGEGEVFFEGVREVALRGKTEIGGNGGERFFRVRQKVAAFLKFFFLNEVGERFASLFLELFGEIRAAHIEMGSQVFRGYRLGNMAADVICRFLGELGSAAEAHAAHALGKVADHEELQIGQLSDVAGEFAFLDIRIA